MNWLRNLPIKWKVILVILLTSTLAVLLTCSVLLVQELVTFRSALAREVAVLADVMGQNSTAALSFGDEGAAKQILAALKAEPRIVAAGLYDTNDGLFAEYLRAGALRQIPALPGAAGHRFERDRLVLFRPVMLNDRRVGRIFLQADLQGMYDRLRSYALIIGIVLLGAVAVTFVLSAGLQRLVSKPILALAAAARRVKETKDYSCRAEPGGRDETGQLTEAFNAMLAEIQARQVALEQANQSLKAQAGQILESVGVLSSSTREISEFCTRLASSATESATAVAQTTTTVEEVRQTTQLASQKAQQVSDSARKTADISQLGKQSTEATIAGTQRIRQQMDLIAASMVRLSEQTQAIGQIIATVEDLAAQSNLLAVNAAIEAVKAGEQGKGFTVVAQEVKSLAEQSKQATAQVRTILSDIQKATGAAVMATEQGTKAVEAGVKQSVQAGASIQALADSVTESAQAAIQIAASGQQQLTGVDQVAAAMESIKLATAQNVASVKQMELSARSLNDVGRRLKVLVEQYKLEG